jgi:hypothetical protein
VILAVDAALGLVEADLDDADVRNVPDLPYLRGAISLPDGLLLIQDLERFLSPGEADVLDVAMTQATAVDMQEKPRAR